MAAASTLGGAASTSGSIHSRLRSRPAACCAPHQNRPCHRRQQLKARAAGAATDPSTTQTLPPFRLAAPRRRFNWRKWEQWTYQELLKQEQEEELLVGDGGDDSWFFAYWDNPSSHRRWLEDSVRLAAWEQALSAASGLLKGKRVLDLGCGTATLAMMAAQEGARAVYAVDASTGAAALARKLVAANGLGAQVTVLQGRGELVRLPDDAVDVIVCDWMGDMLLHNGLLPVLARARDKWLSRGGLIFPDAGTLYVMGVEDREYLSEQKAFWKGVGAAGLDLSPALNAVVTYPRIDTLTRRSQMVTDAAPVLQLDAYTTAGGAQALTFASPFQLTAQRSERVSALLLYFDATFSARGALQPAPQLTTHPMAPATGWLQLLLSFPRAIACDKGDVLGGVLRCKPVGSPPGRMLDLELEVVHKGQQARILYRLRH